MQNMYFNFAYIIQKNSGTPILSKTQVTLSNSVWHFRLRQLEKGPGDCESFAAAVVFWCRDGEDQRSGIQGSQILKKELTPFCTKLVCRHSMSTS